MRVPMPVSMETSPPLSRLLGAAGAGDRATVAEVLDAAACDVNAVDGEGWSCLILAAKAGDLSMVEYLLERGASPNPTRIAHTALRAASIFGHEEVARRLLAAQADPNLCSLHGRTPLMGAAMNKRPPLVQILLEAQADVAAKNDHGETALDLATSAECAEAADMLRRAGAGGQT